MNTVSTPDFASATVVGWVIGALGGSEHVFEPELIDRSCLAKNEIAAALSAGRDAVHAAVADAMYLRDNMSAPQFICHAVRMAALQVLTPLRREWMQNVALNGMRPMLDAGRSIGVRLPVELRFPDHQLVNISRTDGHLWLTTRDEPSRGLLSVETDLLTT